jgi:hypothetical protein
MKTFRKLSLSVLVLSLAFVGCTQQPAEEGAEGEGAQPSRQARSRPRPAPIVVPAGTELEARLITGLNSKDSKTGDTFQATLASPVVVGDKVVLPEGADITGRVTGAKPSGRLKGRAELWVTLTGVQVKGRSYDIATTTAGHKEGSKTMRDVLFIGGGAGAGAAVGGATGGGKGAGIGAAIGAGAGTAAALLTGKRNINFPPETVLRFRLEEELKIQP